MSNVWENDWPDIIMPLSKIPLGPFAGVPLVTVWGAESLFSQIAVPPGFMTPLDGTKQLGSQPGIAEPWTFLIISSEEGEVDCSGMVTVVE